MCNGLRGECFMNEVIEPNINGEKVEAPKYNLKKIFAVFFMILLLYSCSTKFVTITVDNEVWLDKYMFEVLGVQATVVSAVIYLYSLFSKKKKVTYIALVLLIASFAYSAYTYYSVETVVSDMSETVITYIKNGTHYGEGVLFYIISYVLLIIDVFLPGENGFKKVNKMLNAEIEDTLGIKDRYILATYIFGLEKRPDLFHKLSVVIDENATESINININIDSEKPDIISIPKKDIKDITYKAGIISKETMSTSNYGPVENIRDIALFGGVGGAFISSIKGDKIKDYYKMESTKVYDITIVYNANGEEKKIMFQTKEDPTNFIKNLNIM